jgi:hypothetical protein
MVTNIISTKHRNIHHYKIVHIQYISKSMQTENSKILTLPDKEKQI